MENRTHPALHTTRYLFWRAAASLTGWIVQKKPVFQNVVPYAPLILAGTVAYLLGRLLGGLLIRLTVF